MQIEPDYYNKTEEEIALELGVSQQRINQIIHQGLRKFRENWLSLYGEAPPLPGYLDQDDWYPLHVSVWDGEEVV